MKTIVRDKLNAVEGMQRQFVDKYFLKYGASHFKDKVFFLLSGLNFEF